MIADEGRIAAHKVMTLQDTIEHVVVHVAKAASGGLDETATSASFTEADFAGYAALTDPAWDPPVINGSGQAQGKSELLSFTVSGSSPITPQTLVAMYILVHLSIDTTPRLWWFKELAPTVTLANGGETFQRFVDLFVDDITALD